MEAGNLRYCQINDNIMKLAITYAELQEYVLNYFNNRSTNASAESLNSKMKGFRAQVRGVADLPFFMYRMMMVFG